MKLFTKTSLTVMVYFGTNATSYIRAKIKIKIMIHLTKEYGGSTNCQVEHVKQ
jgi:hypothetical protein